MARKNHTKISLSRCSFFRGFLSSPGFYPLALLLAPVMSPDLGLPAPPHAKYRLGVARAVVLIMPLVRVMLGGMVVMRLLSFMCMPSRFFMVFMLMSVMIMRGNTLNRRGGMGFWRLHVEREQGRVLSK